MLFKSTCLLSQVCTQPTQTPATATLVCGAVSFTQTTLQYCGQATVPVPCPGGFTYQNVNPHFFRMACYVSGTLGFIISSVDGQANFDWQLFDVTGNNPENIFTNPNLFVACNWSSEPGETGASPDGTSLAVCGGSGEPTFSRMPEIQAGHTYLLMVVNQTSSAHPYDILFTGGSASITDAVNPQLWSARLSCDGRHVILRLNKDVKCNSLAPDGSDFTLSGGAGIVAASPGDCTPFDASDSITLALDQVLPNGNYTLTIRNGSDGNTVRDLCNRSIAAGESISFVAAPPFPTPFDSIRPVACSPHYLDLVFRKPLRCTSIAADGSDFILAGPSAVPITHVEVNCSDEGTSSIIRLHLASPLTTGGIYQVRLTTGTDGNTLIDECGLHTPEGAVVHVDVQDGVSAAFTFSVMPSCDNNSIAYSHPGGNGISSWEWDLGYSITSTLQSPVVHYPGKVNTRVQLKVSNGICSDIGVQTVEADNQLKADFSLPPVLCPGDLFEIHNNTSGSVDYWRWDFGNGSSSTQEFPILPPLPPRNGSQPYVITLIAGNSQLNCYDTIVQTVRVPFSCILSVPSAFSPNNDGKNDHFYPLNAYHVEDLEFRIYNREGMLLFHGRNADAKWDGTFRGMLQSTGVYAWLLRYRDPDTGESRLLKGTVLLIR